VGVLIGQGIKNPIEVFWGSTLLLMHNTSDVIGVTIAKWQKNSYLTL